MIKKYIIENLFDDVLLYDVMKFLAENSGKEITEWNSYGIYKIENEYPITRYHANLYKGPIHNPGEVVAQAIIEIFAGQGQAEVLVEEVEKWQNQWYSLTSE